MKVGTASTRHLSAMSFRIDPSLHLSEGLRVREYLTNSPYELLTINDVSEKVFLGNIFSRVFVKDKEHGKTYLAASDTVLANIETGRYLSNKQVAQLKHLCLQKDWILVTCSGTLGNVTYTNKTFEDKIATHDLIRIVPNDNHVKKGVVYAFLASKYGYYQITQSQFGGVVKHTNDKQVGAIVIPNFPESFQAEIDDLIQESARLREEATEALEEAHRIIEKHVTIPEGNKSNRAYIKDVTSSHNTRLEGFYYTCENRYIYDYITSHYGCKPLKEYTQKIFRPGIFKREYVQNGVMFLGGADIMMSTPKSEKHLSFRQVERMPELKVEKGWMLVTCGGTIGNSVYIDNQLAKCAISQHVMRIVPKEDTPSGFLYAFLSSKIGYKLITMFTYGAVIPSIEPHHLELVPIPTLEKDVVSEIDKLIEGYATKTELAKEKEALAISKVEQEIERWNHQ